MKILFLVFHGFSEANGISKKIFYQVDGLREAGHEVALASFTIAENGHRVRMIDEQVLEDYGTGAISAFKKRIGYDSLYQYITGSGIEVVYMRSFHNANPFTIRLFKKLRKAGVKSVMEIPTYPYDQEYEGFPLFTRLELQVDKLYRKSLAAQLEGIVTFSDYNSIFGRRTIKISNGIDFEQIAIKKSKNDTSKALNLIGVAEVHYWHGYDRAIAGLGEYYKQNREKKVYLHIVGGVGPSEMYDSDKAPGFSELIKKYNIEEYVIFHGQRSGKELDELFETCDFAIGSLARHRSGIDRIKTLKNREYAARGIPFVYSETDEDFENKPYIIKAPADESPLNIEQIIEFQVQQSTLSPKEIRDSIKELSWSVQMQKVIDAITK